MASKYYFTTVQIFFMIRSDSHHEIQTSALKKDGAAADSNVSMCECWWMPESLRILFMWTIMIAVMKRMCERVCVCVCAHNCACLCVCQGGLYKWKTDHTTHKDNEAEGCVFLSTLRPICAHTRMCVCVCVTCCRAIICVCACSWACRSSICCMCLWVICLLHSVCCWVNSARCLSDITHTHTHTHVRMHTHRHTHTHKTTYGKQNQFGPLLQVPFCCCHGEVYPWQ